MPTKQFSRRYGRAEPRRLEWESDLSLYED